MKTLIELQAMAADDILRYVPPAVLDSIKAKDEHPLFRAYCIGEEGPATPVVIGFGGRVLNWLRSAVSALSNKLQFGTKVFHEHAETNDHSGRVQVGEVVGKALEYVSGKLRAVAVAYIFPSFRQIKADAASIEAEVDLDPSKRSNEIADIHVGDISGIAIFDKSKHNPAFRGATLLSQLQAWAGNEMQGGGGNMTIEEVKSFLKTARIRPSELYDKAELLADDKIGEHILEKLNAEWGRRKAAEEALEALKKEAPVKIADLEKKNQELNRQIAMSKTSAIVKQIIADRKLEGPKQKFVELHIGEFKLEGDKFDDATIKAQLDSFFDSTVKQYDATAAIFNPGNGKGDQQSGGAEDKGDQSQRQTGNPLLKQV